MNSTAKTVFIISANSPSVLEGVLSLAKGGNNLNFTSDSRDEAEKLQRELVGLGGKCGCRICEEENLASIAPAVIDCVEMFGEINTLIFGGWKDCGSKLFLDLSIEVFAFYCSLISDFYACCKCALPYMLGAENPTVIIPLPSEPCGAAQEMYNGAMGAMAENMAREFCNCGVIVKTVPFSPDQAELFF